MDGVFFDLKRAHHATLKFSRRVLSAFELTPARFDVLYAVGTNRWIFQHDLRVALGVARATISEMLKVLEKIGLITRWRWGRRRVVWLSSKGREVMQRALDGCVNNGFVPLCVEQLLTKNDLSRSEFVARRDLHFTCALLRRAFGDSATEELHPWRRCRYESAIVDLPG